jgi:uncharacterized membrane protein
MSVRHESGRLHRLFQLAVVLKGIDGILELIGGALLLLVSPAALHRLVIVLTQHELAEEPDDSLVATLRDAAERFSMETKHFASAYLIGHGVLKVFLAANLLRERRWAFPVAMAVLAVFVVYQSLRFARTHSLLLLALTVVDIVVMALIWREYRVRHKNSARAVDL